jgi:hypothetical protein
MGYRETTIITVEATSMAGFGRFKLTDALPDQPPADDELQSGGGLPGSSPGAKAKGKGKKKGKLGRDQNKLSQSTSPDADAGIRDRVVDIGRSNQQTGRQRTTGK